LQLKTSDFWLRSQKSKVKSQKFKVKEAQLLNRRDISGDARYLAAR
jgi:hypothetical protein